jgi:hypothetical protein
VEKAEKNGKTKRKTNWKTISLLLRDFPLFRKSGESLCSISIYISGKEVGLEVSICLDMVSTVQKPMSWFVSTWSQQLKNLCLNCQKSIDCKKVSTVKNSLDSSKTMDYTLNY